MQTRASPIRSSQSTCSWRVRVCAACAHEGAAPPHASPLPTGRTAALAVFCTEAGVELPTGTPPGGGGASADLFAVGATISGRAASALVHEALAAAGAALPGEGRGAGSPLPPPHLAPVLLDRPSMAAELHLRSEEPPPAGAVMTEGEKSGRGDDMPLPLLAALVMSARVGSGGWLGDEARRGEEEDRAASAAAAATAAAAAMTWEEGGGEEGGEGGRGGARTSSPRARMQGTLGGGGRGSGEGELSILGGDGGLRSPSLSSPRLMSPMPLPITIEGSAIRVRALTRGV